MKKDERPMRKVMSPVKGKASVSTRQVEKAFKEVRAEAKAKLDSRKILTPPYPPTHVTRKQIREAVAAVSAKNNRKKPAPAMPRPKKRRSNND